MRLRTKIRSNSRIQFASNQSKLDPGHSSKVGLRYASLGNFMEHFVLCKKGCNELAIKGKSHYTAMLQVVEILTKLACF